MNKFSHGVIGSFRSTNLKALKQSLKSKQSKELEYALPHTSDVDVIIVPVEDEYQPTVDEILEEVYGGPLLAEISIKELPAVKKPKKRTRKKRTRKKKTTEAS